MTRPAALLALAAFALAPPARADEPKAENFALLVGVNEYDHSELNRPKPLQYAENDVTEFAALLEKLGYKDNVVVLSGGKATKKAVMAEVEKLKKRGNGRGTVVVGFAGHGVQFEKDEEAYFCPFDTEMREAKRNGEVVKNKAGQAVLEPDPESCVRLTDVIGQFVGAKAGNRVLLADCCRNDPTTGRGIGRAVGAGIKTSKLPDNTALLLSCSEGEIAYEHKAWKHGVFFDQVIKGIEGGKGDVDALWMHLKTAVPDALDALDLAGSPKQKPYRLFNGDVTFGLVGGKHVTAKLPVEKEDLTARAEETFREAYKHKYGIGVKVDEWKALAAFEKARKLGHPIAAMFVARYYRDGALVGKDEKHAGNLEAGALDALEALADKKNAEAVLALGVLYEKGFTVKQDQQKARGLYAKSEGIDHSAQAQFALGYVNLEGIGGAQDHKAAVEWLNKGVKQGDAKCQSLMAIMYNNGLAVPKDDKEAVRLYKLAADQNLPKARFNLGLHYASGDGVPPDIDKAVEQYLEAAKQNDQDALCNLGNLYESGRGVPKDLNKSYWCFDRAAAQGHAQSQYNLGMLYLTGTGVIQNEERALVLFRRASAAGNKLATDKLRSLARNP